MVITLGIGAKNLRMTAIPGNLSVKTSFKVLKG
jgi:hypothetical protein